ncbi:MAG: Monoacylglycerol lipase [Anaerolineae bacterium]|nr:Monoacylglycerol lipase [Anaerolineae bacterium]
MTHATSGWRSPDGLQIFAQSWQPETAPRAVVCLVHGLGEHSSRYGHVARAFNRAGFCLTTFDLPGHGQSGGKRGHALTYAILLDNITTLLNRAAEDYPGLPCFLYGHSFGGNLALNYVLRRRPTLAGAIVTSPWLQLATEPPALQTRLLALADRVWPGLTFATRLDITAVSRDPNSVRAYQTDPLNHDRISVRLATEANRAGAWALAHAAEFTRPLLLMHGSHDRITSHLASQEFARRAPNCTFKLWDGLFHEPHNEPEQGEVIDFILNWIEARLV